MDPRVIGAMGGHVDDFHQIGDEQQQEWLDIKHKNGSLFKWGMSREGNYRHAGMSPPSTTTTAS